MARSCAQGQISKCGCSTTKNFNEYNINAKNNYRGNQDQPKDNYFKNKHFENDFSNRNHLNHKKKAKNDDSPSDFAWQGCDDDVNFAEMFSRWFTDVPWARKNNTKKEMVNRHNSAVGRKVGADGKYI